jgi:hypothetical protein
MTYCVAGAESKKPAEEREARLTEMLEAHLAP